VKLRGVVPPLVTPFRPDGALDLPVFQANLETLRDSGPAAPLAGNPRIAMDLAGLRGGAARAPLLPIPDAAREEIRPLLEQALAAI
jgi:dihydrodipicolinate synthase/N-acetylneuraminate lyase